jgi:hypothetical protein
MLRLILPRKQPKEVPSKSSKPKKKKRKHDNETAHVPRPFESESCVEGVYINGLPIFLCSVGRVGIDSLEKQSSSSRGNPPENVTAPSIPPDVAVHEPTPDTAEVGVVVTQKKVKPRKEKARVDTRPAVDPSQPAEPNQIPSAGTMEQPVASSSNVSANGSGGSGTKVKAPRKTKSKPGQADGAKATEVPSSHPSQQPTASTSSKTVSTVVSAEPVGLRTKAPRKSKSKSDQSDASSGSRAISTPLQPVASTSSTAAVVPNSSSSYADELREKHLEVLATKWLNSTALKKLIQSEGE